MTQAASDKKFPHDWFLLWDVIERETLAEAGEYLLARLHSKKKFAVLCLNSTGGDGWAARGLVGLMEICKAQGMEVRTFATGEVCSAAFDIFVAGSERYLSPDCLLMVHASSMDGRDRVYHEMTREFDRGTLKTYTRLTPQRITRILEGGNTYFTPETAVDSGIADHIVEIGSTGPWQT